MGLALGMSVFLNATHFTFAANEKDWTGVLPVPAKVGDIVGVRTIRHLDSCSTAVPRQVPNPDGGEGSAWAFPGALIGGSSCGGDFKWKGTDQVTMNWAAASCEMEARLKEMPIGNKIKGGCVQLSDIPIMIIKLIDLLTKLAGTVAVIFGLYAGFQLITSGITEDREAAKNTLKYAATGLAIALLAWLIVNLVQVQLTA